MAVPLRTHVARGPSLASHYRTYPAEPSVRPFAGLGWAGVAGWSRSIRLLPDGCVDLVARDGRLVAVLPTPGPRRVEPRANDRPVGLRLRCGTAGTLLGHDLSRLPPGEEVDLAELCGEPVRRAPREFSSADTALAALVRVRLAEGARPDTAALRAVRLLRAPRARVDAVAAELGLSPRTLHRRVAAQVGYGPKQLHRVLRFQRFLAALPRLAERWTELAELAAELGYADQPHLGRDCRELTGTSPARLLTSWSGH